MQLYRTMTLDARFQEREPPRQSFVIGLPRHDTMPI